MVFMIFDHINSSITTVGHDLSFSRLYDKTLTLKTVET